MIFLISVSTAWRGERSSEAAGSAAILRQIIPIISLGQRAALSALLLRANCQPDTLPIPPIRENLGVLLRTCVRSRWLSLYAHTQRKTGNAPYRGIKSRPCPPAIGGEVGLHKGFDAHKALDTPPGRIDDVVGGFQITSLYSVTEESTFSRSPCMAFLPPSGGVFRLSLAGSSPGIPCRRSCGFQGAVLDLAIKNRHTTT